MHVDVSLAMGSLFGALAAAVFAKIFADRLRMPAVTFTFPGVVTLLPAPEAFRAVLGALTISNAGATASSQLIGVTVALAVTTLLVIAGIAVGLSFVLAMPLKGVGRPSGKVEIQEEHQQAPLANATGTRMRNESGDDARIIKR